MKYSDKEQQLINALHFGDFLNQEPLTTYRTLALHCFSKGLQGALADSVRRCYNALQDGTPYRLTPEFDNLITFSYDDWQVIVNNYKNIPTEDWLKFPETKPKESGYYLTTYLSDNLYYKCIYWDNQTQQWNWQQPFEVGCFVEKTKSKSYNDCLNKLRELYNYKITTF